MTLTVDFTTTLSTMGGFGASGAFAIPYDPAVADFLWRSDIGIGLSLCRLFITPNGYPVTNTVDGNPAPGSAYAMDSSALGADDHSYAVAIQAATRGAKVWGTIWAFPTAWQGGSPNGALATAHYTDGANLLVSFVDQAWTLGLPIYYVGMCNEPDISPSYPQTSWTTTTAINFIKNNLSSALATWGSGHPSWQAATGLSAPGIVVPQTSAWSALAAWINAVEGDSTAVGEVALYGVHQYFGGSVSAPPGTVSHPIWETESVPAQGTSWDATMTHALTTVNQVHNAIVTGNATSWHYWLAEDVSDTDNSGLVGTPATNWTNPTLSIADWRAPIYPKRCYALGQFAKFIRPGWLRVSVSGAPSGVNATAYMDASKTGCAIVCINTNGSSTAITISLTNLNASTITPWITDASNNLAAQAPIAVSSGSFSTTLGANSVTTFYVAPVPQFPSSPSKVLYVMSGS